MNASLPVWKYQEPASLPVWKYQDPRITGGRSTSGNLADYPAGGYIADLGRSKKETDDILNYLFEHQWLDEYSRAVFVELTLFNTNANFFIYASLLAEFTAAGGSMVHKKVVTTRLDRYSSGFAVFIGACEILFLTCTLYYMYREVSCHEILQYLVTFKDNVRAHFVTIVALCNSCPTL